jgi:hypothetical protein
MRVITQLFDQYRPATLVIEDTTIPTKRGFRTQALLRSTTKLAKQRRAKVVRCTKKQVKVTFAPDNARTRPAIAEAIAKRIPAFAHRLPSYRKIWMSEDPRQSLFDAAALALTHYAANSCFAFVPPLD